MEKAGQLKLLPCHKFTIVVVICARLSVKGANEAKQFHVTLDACLQASHLLQHIWVGHDDPQVNVHWGDEATLELKLPKFDRLHV